MSDGRFDVVVIGGGPGGYVACIRAAQLGLKTACVEKRETLGGTCLNVGCIPSKALLHSSERYREVQHELGAHGIEIPEVHLDLAAMMARKDEVVKGLTGGVAFLLEKNKVEWVKGSGRIPEAGVVEVELAGGGSRRLEAEHILIATGSEATSLPGIEIDEERIVTSTGALALERVPEKLVVIGAGVIGLELGSVWSRLGAEVGVIEFLDHILPGMDGEIARATKRILEKQGLSFQLSSRVTAALRKDEGVSLSWEPSEGSEAREIAADVVLVAVGRRPYTDGLGLDELGVERDERGVVRVDARFRTNVEGIYAIGDCAPGPMLAHKAEDEGILCVEGIAGGACHMDHDLVPAVVYTWPEVACVGKTQEALDEADVDYRIGKFRFAANSRSRTTGETEGLVKVIACERTDRLLGVHIVGPLAGDLIQEAVVAMEFGACAEDLARTCHAHPGMGEALKEAALAVARRAIHA